MARVLQTTPDMRSLANPCRLPLLPALAGLALTGCMMGAPEPLADDEEENFDVVDSCYDAAEALEQCTGEVPEGFIEACTYEPDEQSMEAIEELVNAQCDDIDPNGKADGLFEGAFARVCEPAVISAYLVTRHRNPPGQSLTTSQRRALRPFFGNFVDHARIHFDAALVSEWRVLGMDIQINNTAAMAFGLDLYLAQEYRPDNNRQLALVAHELTHTWQAARLGSVRTFANEYCRGYYQASFSYADNAFEVEARDVQRHVRDCLDNGRC